MKVFPYQQKRIIHDDQSWSDVSIVEFPADKFRFDNIILQDKRMRMRDAAHLRLFKAHITGQINPVIVVWACLENDQSATDIFPDVNAVTDNNETLFSANSLINYTMRTLLARGWLFYEAEQWHITVPQDTPHWQHRAQLILDWLIKTERLLIYTDHDYTPTRQDFIDFPIQQNAIPVGRCGFLRRAVAENDYRLAFNAGYFLLEEDDFINHHSALGDPYNLLIADGIIERPPLYHRSMIGCTSDNQWFVDTIGLDDLVIHIENHHLSTEQGIYQFSLNPDNPHNIAVYTNYWGVETSGRVLGYTPVADGRTEFTIIDRNIVSMQIGGNLAIPQNGFVLSLSNSLSDSALVSSLNHTPQLTYHLDARFEALQHAVQCGPMLLKDGQMTTNDNNFTDEQFWISRVIDNQRIIGVVPTDYPTDVATTRAGRVGLGIKDDQTLVVVAISGVNAGFDHNNTDSMGATLLELTQHLMDAGAVSAINFDGGGSTQLFLNGGAMTRAGDRRGLRGIIYDRMIPTAGIVI